jgi:osmoprotectant transport system ATP-binding protein
VLLLDEPMGALDPMVRAGLQRDLKHLFDALDKTVVLVTHSLDEAGYLGDEVALMRAGRIVERGKMHDLERSRDAFTRAFVEAQRGGTVAAPGAA